MRELEDLSIFQFRASTDADYSGTRVKTDHCFIPEQLTQAESLSCRHAGSSVLRDYGFMRRRKQHFLSLEYIYEGEMHIRSGKHAYIAEAGDLCFLHAHYDNEFLHLPGSECRKAGMIPVGTILPELLRIFHLENVNVIHLNAELWDSFFIPIRNTLRRFMEPEARSRLSGLMFELFDMLASQKLAVQVHPDAEAIRTYLDLHFTETVHMEEIAKLHKMSLPTMNSRFRESFHITPYQYLIRQRLFHAANLLGGSDLSIKEICERTGYGNSFHFSAEFSRFYGCSPREFRKRNRSL